jgi:hypothetical protein
MCFPYLFWLPWILYQAVYLMIDFSFLGLQLTLQYLLPIMVGVVVSGFTYYEEDLEWIFKWFKILCIAIYAMFVIGFLFRGGYGPAVSASPMLLTISFSLLAATWYLTKNKIFLGYLGVIFLMPVLELSRMGIAAMAAVFILHFANNGIKDKLVYGSLGAIILLFVFNTEGFQKKTFYKEQGSLSDLTLNYYDNPGIKISGRSSWRKALEPGLKAEPVWGNGPRADNAYLSKISKKRGGEAHNDYLSVRFNYGYVGLSLLLFGFAASFISLYRISKRNPENYYIWLISTSLLTLYITFLMFMYTDNILKYTIYFPNYFFAMIGIVYSLKRDEDLRGYTALQ